MARAMSHIVGIILALMIVIAIMTGMYFWFFKMQASQMSGVEQSHSAFTQKLGANCLSITGFSHNVATNKSTITLQNCGDTDFKIGDKKIEDTIIVSPNKCSVSLSLFNCDRCPFELKSGKTETFNVLWRYLPECSINDYYEKELLFVVDGTAYASVRFTPDTTVTCGPKLQRAITTSNPSGWGLTNYQIILFLNTSSFIVNGTMRSDCADLEFKDSDATTDIPFFIETVDTDSGCNKNTTKIFIKVPAIPTSENATFFIVYNNSGAITNKSNASNTFAFYDDFAGSSLDTSRWPNAGSAGATASVSNGNLTLFFNSTQSVALETAATYPISGLVVETREAHSADMPSGGSANLGAFVKGIDASYARSGTDISLIWFLVPNNISRYRFQRNFGPWSPFSTIWSGPILYNKFYIMQHHTAQTVPTQGCQNCETIRNWAFNMSVYNDSLLNERFLNGIKVTNTNSPDSYSTDGWNMSLGNASAPGASALDLSGADNATLIYDWIRVYQRTITEPTVTIGVEQLYCG